MAIDDPDVLAAPADLAPEGTASNIADGVRSGALDPVTVVNECFRRITAIDPRLGAFQLLRPRAALREARELTRRSDLDTLPLAGVPIAIKDNIPLAGEPLRCGSAATSDEPSGRDHEVVRRLRAAGAIVVGKTRVPELCIWPFTDGALGTARNPWDLEHTPGGSSGGSAAAVAAGLVPIAHGNDGLGSVRIPAAACGVLGWKPADGVVPADVGNGSWFGMAANGVLATTVDDAERMAAVMAGRAMAARQPDRRCRIALATASPVPGARTAPEVEAAVHAVADVLRAAGHEVVPIRLAAPTGVALAVFAHWFAGTAADAATVKEPSRLLRRTRVHARLGRIVQSLGGVRPGARERWRAEFRAMLAGYDLLLTPTTATTAIAAEGWAQQGWFANVRAALAFAPFTGAVNFAGLAALSVPAGLHAGLPVGAHLVALHDDDALLFQLARQVESARPWPRVAAMAHG